MILIQSKSAIVFTSNAFEAMMEQCIFKHKPYLHKIVIVLPVTHIYVKSRIAL